MGRVTQPGRAGNPGAPAPAWLPEGAYIEDGMVVYRDQGWTFEEWEAEGPKHPPGRPRVHPAREPGVDRRIKYHTDEERREAKRRQNREHMRRVRARRAA